jgi:hypothetical protein
MKQNGTLYCTQNTTVAAQSGFKDHPHHTYQPDTFTQQQQDMVLTSQ